MFETRPVIPSVDFVFTAFFLFVKTPSCFGTISRVRLGYQRRCPTNQIDFNRYSYPRTKSFLILGLKLAYFSVLDIVNRVSAQFVQSY